MEKVKIPKGIAEIIERTRDVMSVFDCEEDLNDTQFTLYRVLDNVNKQYHEKWLNEGENLELLVKAIRDGYEVEQTIEEKVLDMYQRPELGVLSEPYECYREGIENVLHEYGIKIKGINI